MNQNNQHGQQNTAKPNQGKDVTDKARRQDEPGLGKQSPASDTNRDQNGRTGRNESDRSS